MRKNLFIHLVFVLPLFFVINCKQDIDNVEKEHTFSEWQVESESTCTSIGLKKRKCTGCGFEETEIIPSKGHNWNQGVITAKATCTSAGVKTYTCSRCKEEKTEVIPANGHKWDSGIVTKQPTCTENGIRTYTCSVCNEIKMESVKARGHSFDGIECKNCHEYSVKLSEIGKTYTDADGLNVTLNSFTYANTDGYNNYSINYTLKNNVPGSEKSPGIFKIIYKTSSGSLESSYQTGFFNNLYYGNTLTRSYNWKLTADKTFVCLEYIADSQMSSYIFSATPSDELLNWINGEISYDIDIIPPSPVTNLQAKYDKNSKEIVVTWKNPTDEDFDYVDLSYTKGGLAVVSNEKIAKENYSINDVEIDGDEYLFKLVAVDWMGNISTSSTISITPSEIPAVQSIELSRYHLAYDDPDQTINVVANLSNADLIKDDTVIKIQTKDSNGNVTNTVATLDKIAGTATAKITVPSSNINSSNSGETYTVLCKIGDESADTTHTARFNVSAAPNLSSISQSLDGFSYSINKVQIALVDVTSNSTVNVRLEGTNFDLTTPSIQFYDSIGAAYYASPIAVDTSSVLWTSVTGENYQTIDTVVSIPPFDDTYTVKVLFDGVVQTSATCTLQVYDVPKFTSLIVPKVCITKENNAVTAKIVGKNFDTPGVDLGNFNATCSTKASIVASTSFTRESDSVLNATFTIPGTVGDYSINVSYGANSVNGTLKAADYSSYHVGDVLLNDGTVVAYDDDNLSFNDDQKTKAVGVMYGFNDYGSPLGWLGLYNSARGTNSGCYQWAPDETIGYNTTFTGIICEPTNVGDATSTVIGDTDGSDNWAYICSVDPDGTADAAINYPAFNYVNNYATTFGLTGDYATGWYMPSLAELCYIDRQITVLNQVLDALGTIQLCNDAYWSSSQKSYTNSPWGLRFGSWCFPPANADLYVCCIRAFE